MSLEGDRVRQIRKLLFAPHIVKESARLAKKTKGSRRPRLKHPMASRMPDIFEARNVGTPDGAVGYIRIFSFNADREDFVAEFERLLTRLTSNGLIIDVRDNPGGHIGAGERLLQLLGGTPPIEPERLFLISTPLTLRLCRLQRSDTEFGPKGLEPWRKSLARSAATGAQFSASFPYTDPKLCNDVGRKYDGPVVVVTNARSYSATEFFAAGFQDHGIGRILGIADSTGGGGANVRMHEELMVSFAKDPKSPFRALPKQSGFTVAFRRSQRVREQAGSEVEDFGVASDEVHRMTREDLLHHNIDLIYHAARRLAGKRKRSSVARGKRTRSKKTVKTGARRKRSTARS
jgi:C-terminal processing protease CtpA/Prc